MSKQRSPRTRLKALVALMATAWAAPGYAVDFELADGWTGNWTSSISLGSAWRARDADSRLYGQSNGALVGKTDGTGNNTIDEGNLNYNKGDAFTTQAKLFTEVAIKKGEAGALIRAKAWYDYTQQRQNVHLGSSANGYNGYSLATNSLGGERPLSDKGFDDLNKFKGIYLLDAYIYNTFEVGGSTMQARLGNQVANWGESLFIQGINQVNPIDVPSFRKPGAQLKEVFIPVPLIQASQSLGSYGSLEAYYQLYWKPTPIEAGCGNYWAVAAGSISARPGSCNMAVTLTPSGGNAAGLATGAYIPFIDGEKGSNDGQFGLAYRFNSSALDTEFGVYAQRINSRTPVLNGHFGQGGATLSPIGMSWDYVNDIKIYGLSAATNLLGVSVGAELSHSRGVPAQIDGNDLLLGALAAVGPMGSRSLAAQANGGFYQGYTRTNKTQFQLNGVKAGNGVLGSDQYVLIGEVGFQWNDLPDYKKDPNALRYGRNFIFGPGSHPTYGGSTCGTLNVSAEGCENDGYVSRFAWGYRGKVELTYNNVFDTGVTFYPSVFFSHDVKGISVDSQFLESRRALGLGARFSYAKTYTLELGAVTYNHNAKYDPLRDRDFFSATLGMNF